MVTTDMVVIINDLHCYLIGTWKKLLHLLVGTALSRSHL